MNRSTCVTFLSIAVVVLTLLASISSFRRQRSLTASLQAAFEELPTFTEFDKLGEGPFEVGVISMFRGSFACKSFSRETLAKFFEQEKMYVKLDPPAGFSGNSKVNIGLEVRSFASPEECRAFKSGFERTMRQLTGKV